MKQTIEINVPEGFKAIWNETTQQIDLVKIDNRPRSWEEFCETHKIKEEEAYINSAGVIINVRGRIGELRDYYLDKNWCTSKEEAEAFLALMQLRQLRKAWVGDWEPDWNTDTIKWVIRILYDNLIVDNAFNISHVLSFPTEQMAREFLECFKNLIETAKILL